MVILDLLYKWDYGVQSTDFSVGDRGDFLGGLTYGQHWHVHDISSVGRQFTYMVLELSDTDTKTLRDKR
jgi:hypothetical protein